MCKYHQGAAPVAQSNPYRLPDTVLPESYKLRLVPDLDAATYSGEVTINLKVLQPVDEIVLNAITLDEPGTPDESRNLAVTEALVRRDNGTAFTGTIVEEPKEERIRVKVNGTIGTGDWQLTLRFTGVLNDKLKGFYRSTYKDGAGVEQVIATTQFESTDARRAFPCFDEPAMKATLQLTLEVNEDLVAVGNARVVSVTNLGNGKKVVEFAPTMKMSTYIAAWVVGKLVSTKPINVDGVEVRTWCVPGKEHLASFGLQTAQFALRYYRRYFGVAYPGDKLDMLAIPDFAAGAMENIGCVTFREGALLVDPATASQQSLDWVAEVVAHELAHMWFGDLVTMKWWNGLWLNEAFATFMAAKCTDAWKSEWAVWDKFGLARGTAMRTDALGSTRPVEFTVNAPEDAAAMFDVLTYEKGCSVMRMLEQFLGEDVFQKGIAAYISGNAYGNTETVDLWNALESASGQPVSEIMHGWIFKSGYPVVSVRNADVPGSITLSQQSFKFLANAVDAEQRWMIPVMLRARTADGVIEKKHLLKDKEETIYLGENLDWVVVNAGGHGFFRVIYSHELLNKLTANVQGTLSVIERVNLVSDAWAGVQSGLRRSTEFVELVKLFGDESNPNVWSVISSGLGTLRRMLPVSHRPKFELMVRGLAKPQFDRLGWTARNGESSQDGELRGDLIHMLGMTGKDEHVRGKAPEVFTTWKNNRSAVAGDVLGSVITILAATGDGARYDEFYALYKGAKNPEEESNFLYALATFRNIDLLKRTLGYALDSDHFRTQDAPSVVARVLNNPIGYEAAWQFVKENWDEMVKLYPESGFVRLCGGVTALNTPELEADVRAWFASHTVKGAGKAIDQYLEMLHVQVLLRQRDQASLSVPFAPDPDPVPAVVATVPAASAAEPTVSVPEGHGTGVKLHVEPTPEDSGRGLA